LMVVLFLTTSNAAFAQRYDTASAFVAGGSGAYQAILNNAITNGFTPARTVSILGTILVTPVALTSLGWVGYAQEQAGEIQGAQSLKNQMFLSLGGYRFAYLYNLVPNYQVYTLAVTAVATVMYIGTALGGAVFPWTRKEVYRTAPISKFTVGPIPLITICGVIAAAFSATMLYYFLTVPFLVNVD